MRNKEKNSVNNGEYVVKKTKGLDLAAKIMSVLIALVIWLYAISANSTSYEYPIPGVSVSVNNVPEGLSVISGYSSTVNVTVQGKRSEVLSLIANKDVTAYVDASECTEPGHYTLPVTVNLPSNVKLSNVDLDKITVYIDAKTEKHLPITINLKNYTVADGCVLEKSTPNVTSVKVSGPADELKNVKEAVVTIEPGTISSSMNASGSVVLYDNDGKVFSNPYVSCSVTDVLVHIEVYKYKTVPLYVDYKYGYYNDDTVTVTLEPSSIKVKSKSDDNKTPEPIKIATIDETTILEDCSKVVKLPADITPAEQYDSVTVTIKHKNTATKTLAVKNFEILNPEDGKTYSVVPEFINVTLRGKVSDYFSFFEADDIMIKLDMNDCKGKTGIVDVPALIDIKNYSTDCVIYAVGSYSVSLNIS